MSKSKKIKEDSNTPLGLTRSECTGPGCPICALIEKAQDAVLKANEDGDCG